MPQSRLVMNIACVKTVCSADKAEPVNGSNFKIGKLGELLAIPLLWRMRIGGLLKLHNV
jgi:hypothetical protein